MSDEQKQAMLQEANRLIDKIDANIRFIVESIKANKTPVQGLFCTISNQCHVLLFTNLTSVYTIESDKGVRTR